MGYLKKHLQFLILSTLGIAAFIRGIIFLDPDFGWHLRTGELILQKGIPLTDPFSYTMPLYRFVDHEWLSDALIASGFKSIGIYGLALVFALIFVAAIFLAVPKQFKNYAALPLALCGGLMLGFVGIRVQVITLFFLALLLRIIFDDNLWRKWEYAIPLVFIFWANLHGGFAIGIVLLFLVFIFKSVQNKRFELGFFGVFLFSLAVTFVNPYGLRLWQEVWLQATDQNLRWSIGEFTPGIFDTDISLLILFVLSFSFILRYRAKIAKLQILIYLLFLLMAISALRHIPLWALSAVFITSAGIKLLTDEVGKNKFAAERFRKLTKILLVVIFAVFAFEIVTGIIGAFNFSEKNFYPVKAAAYLAKRNFTDGNLFSFYDYGGYLIWKLPGKKVFIDGRMTSWKMAGTFPNQSNYIFKNYLKMLSDVSYFKETVKKYDIHYFLLPVQQAKPKRSYLAQKLDNIMQKFTLWKTNTAVLDGDLTKLGLRKIYQDSHFAVYKI